MNPVTKFSKSFPIELRDVDLNRKLKWSSLFSYFQDVANDAVDNLGIGIKYLQSEYGVAWILTKMKVDLMRTPLWNETILIETWPQEPKSLEFERDFIVKDANGDEIIRAISTWIIIDVATHRIKRSNTIPVNYPEIILERALPFQFSKLNPIGEVIEAYRKRVGYSDVDFNGHLNNSKYIDFIADCFSIENHLQYNVKSIEVQFIHEALPEETIILYKDISEVQHHRLYIEGQGEKDSRIIFKSFVEITPIDEEKKL